QHAMAEGKADPDFYTETATRVMEVYRHRIDMRASMEADAVVQARRSDEIERRLRLTGLAAEREELVRLGRQRLIDEETARKLIREIDLQELRYI
ncbi:MAG TPA: Na+/H+ antiporter, partial [Brevundimonas sp.]|nr:Na+/H+ antiporter [Brevundimonas sp.]